MKKILFLLLAFLVCHSNYLFAQKRCGSELDVEELQKTDPKHYERLMQFNKLVEQYSSSTTTNERIIDPNGTIIIPVVFHLLYDGNEPPLFLNPTDARVQSQIAVLNEDFRRLNPNRVNTPIPFQSVAADVNIEFRLACIDPNGNPTTGITRRDVGTKVFRRTANEFTTGIKYTSQGGQDAWATDKYLNIWVVSRMETFDDDRWQDLLGYGTFPDKYIANPNTDGVAILASQLGRGLNAVGSGRTATHEIGHWLGLFHVWGRENSCVDGNDGDYVADTPVQKNPSPDNFCPTFPLISCPNEGANGAMFMNFMDYSQDFCMNMFTNGQKARMRANFLTGGIRASFVNNYFKIKELPSNICIASGSVIPLQNVHCLPVVWSVSGATITSQSSQGVTLSGSGRVTLTATSGNYTDTKTFDLGPVITTSNSPNEMCLSEFSHSQNLRIDQGSVIIEGIGFDANSQFEWQRLSNNFTYRTVKNVIHLQPSTIGSISFRVRVLGSCGWSAWKIFTYNVVYCQDGNFFKVYPNPAKESITIDFNPNKDQNKENQKQEYTQQLKIELYNSYQKLVFEEKFERNEKSTAFKINTSKLPNGVYYLKIINEKEVYTERIIIEN